MLTFKNPTHFRQIIVCSILAERPVIIENIRYGEPNPGLAEYEVTLLKLIDQVTNGSKIQIEEKGKSVKFYPGVVTNNHGNELTFDCGTFRSMTYFMEPLVQIAIFGKANLNCVMKGITNDELDPTVDTFSNCTLRTLKEFGVDGQLDLKVYKRGFRPEAGGEARLRVSFVKGLKAIQWLDEGKVKRIRGVACASKVSPQIINRIVNSARNVLNDYIPDVWIYSDYYKGLKAGNSPGYSVNLIAESTSGSLISADECLEEGLDREENLPEEIGDRVALRLLDELFYSGCIDTSHQPLVFTLMALSEKKVSAVKVGRISNYTMQYLRNLRLFFGVKFQIKNAEDKIIIEEDEDEDQDGDQNGTEGPIVREYPQ